jgi:hypothetical protein
MCIKNDARFNPYCLASTGRSCPITSKLKLGFLLLVLVTYTDYGYASTELVPINANLPTRPLIETLHAIIGVCCSPEFSAHESIEEAKGDRYKFNLGSGSVALFDQVFVSMFERVTPVQNPPPLRTDGPRVDAVIEPRIGYLRIEVSPKSQNADEYCWVKMYYHIALCSPDGGLVALFRVNSVGESRSGYSIGVKSFGEAMHFAMRDAAAQVMTGSSDGSGVREWLQALGVLSSLMLPKSSERLNAAGQK